MYKEATNYFKAVMNGRTDPLPIKKWEKEWETLTAEKYALCDEYYRLDDELRNVETLKRTAIQMMSEIELERTPSRTQGINR